MLPSPLKCSRCNSIKLVKNGTNGVGNPKYKCKSCNFSGVITTKRTSAEKKDLACACYLEKSSLRGIGRVFNVSGNTVSSWVKKNRNSPSNSRKYSPYTIEF